MTPTKNGDIQDDALGTSKMNNELANKYANYVGKKLKQQKTGRLQNSYVDSGRNKVYKSEWGILNASSQNANRQCLRKRLPSSSNVLSSLRLIKHSEKGCSNPKLEFMKTVNYNARIAGQATYGMVRLQPSCGMNKWVVLHELAHTVGHMHHDLPFRGTLLKLISRFLGVEVAKELKRQFRKNKVKMTVSQTIKSPEKWLQDYNKMVHHCTKKGN